MISSENGTNTAACFTTREGYISLLAVASLIFVAILVLFIVIIVYHRCKCATRRIMGFAISGTSMSMSSLIQFAVIVAKPDSCSGTQISAVVLMSVSAFFLIIVTVTYITKLQGTQTADLCGKTQCNNKSSVM